MYAVILTGGKQYSVKVGDSIFVEKLNAEADSEVTFEKVLAVGEEGAENSVEGICEGLEAYLRGEVGTMKIDWKRYNERAVAQFESLFD